MALIGFFKGLIAVLELFEELLVDVAEPSFFLAFPEGAERAVIVEATQGSSIDSSICVSTERFDVHVGETGLFDILRKHGEITLA